jgi:16S rRNA (guanine1207-N2)-methyltransferase
MTSGHYFQPDPTGPSRPREVSLVLPDHTIDLHTDSGVFSADRVDAATKLLLVEGPPPPHEPATLLDLGCGYGPIAVTLALRAPASTVWAVDVNGRARDLCRKNAERHAVAERVHVVRPGEVDPHVRFDQIWSNPPIRIGKAALHELLAHWLGRLSPQGSAHLVVSRHLGADSLARWLAGEGFEVSRRGSRMGYRLLDVRPPQP